MDFKGEWVLKQFARTVFVTGLLMAVLPLSAMAESFERPWKNSEGAKQQKSTGFLKSFLPKKSPTGKPAAPVAGTINIVPAKKKSPTVRKAKVRKAKIRKAKPIPAKTAQKKPGNAGSNQGQWWENVGNPVVFAFRDCSVGFAKSQASAGTASSPAEVITAAMKTSCQVEFAKMAGVLIGGLGEKKSNIMLTELAKTTFLPPVAAALAEKRKIQVAQATVVSKQQNLTAAKQEMFRCFSQRTDRLSVAKNTQANTIADAVLAGCKTQSDAFFDLLFANSKASSQVKRQQKNIALNETYKIAIIRRVLATRKPPKVRTAIQQ